MIEKYKIPFYISDEEKANIIKERISKGNSPYEISVAIRIISAKSGRSMVYIIEGKEFIREHPELFN